MLFVMMAIFFFCIFPYRIFSIWAVFAETKDLQDFGIQNYYNILTISRIMFYINSMVNPILKDRMYSIQTKGYNTKEKITIANDYLLPKIREQVNFKKDEIIIPDDVLEYIIKTPGMTKMEDGVRNFKRCLEIIYTKLNLFRLVKSDSNILTDEIDLKVTFPFTVTKKDVDALIRNDEKQSQSLIAMYC